MEESEYFQGIDIDKIKLDYKNKIVDFHFNKSHFNENNSKNPYRFYLIAFNFFPSNFEKIQDNLNECNSSSDHSKIISNEKSKNTFISNKELDAEYFYIVNRKNEKKQYMGLMIFFLNI